MKKPKPKSSSKNTLWVKWGLSIIVMLAPFFRGAFFPGAILVIQTCIFAIASLWLVTAALKKETIPLRDPIHWILLLMVVAYLIPLLTHQWFNLEETIAMVLWQLSILCIVGLTREVTESPQAKKQMIGLIITLAVMLSIMGWLSLAGFIQYTDAVLAGRLASTFQYPNTLAALVMSVYFLTLGQYQIATSGVEKRMLMSASWILLITLILTYSRIAWLLFPIIALGYWGITPKENKPQVLLVYSIQATVSLLLLTPLHSAIPIQQNTSLALLLWISAGAMINGSLQFIIDKKPIKPNCCSKKFIVIGASVIMVLGIVALFLLPEAISQRIMDINIDQRSAYERIAFSQDAFAIFIDQPFTGSGGGAWEARYEAFQTQPYTSRLTHNHILQTMVEAGISGMLALVSLVVILLLRGSQAIKKKDVMTLSLITAILSLLLHSSFDFNFSFFSITIIFWMMIGFISWEPQTWQKPAFKKAIKARTVFVLLLPILVLSGLRLSAHHQYEKGMEQVQHHQNIEIAYEHLEKSIAQNPFHPGYRSNMAQVTFYRSQISNSQQDDRETIAIIEKGLAYAPNHARLTHQAIEYYRTTNNKEKFEKRLDQYIAHRRIKPQAYAFAAFALNQYADIQHENGQESEAKELYQQTIDLLTIFQENTKPLSFSIKPSEEFLESVEYARKKIKSIESIP